MTRRTLIAATTLLVGCSAINPLSNHGVLVLKPEITPSKYQTKAEVVRYTKDSINHLTLRLFNVDGGEHDLNVQRVVQNADLTNPVTFSGLKAGRTYRVKASAYLTADDSQLISTTASDSYTDILVENNDAPNIGLLKVKLIDSPFNGQGTGSIGFVPAEYTYPGDESIDSEVVADLPYNLAFFAGDGTNGFSGDGGVATLARLKGPKRVASDAAGNVYVADYSGARVRKIATDGIITTVAGNGLATFDGTPGVATGESIIPDDIAVDAAGVLYIADGTNRRLYKVDTDGNLTVLAGTGVNASSGDNGPATAAEITPSAVAIDPNGLVYVADSTHNRIRKITAEGNIVTVAGNGNYPSINWVGDFSLYTNPDGLATATPISCSAGMTFDAAGNLYFADGNNGYIRKVVLGGNISTIAGNGDWHINEGGQATASGIGMPEAADFDAAGNLYVANAYNILKIGTDGIVKVIAGSNDYNSTYTGATGAAIGIPFGPTGVVVGAAGNLYAADRNAYRVFKLSH